MARVKIAGMYENEGSFGNYFAGKLREEDLEKLKEAIANSTDGVIRFHMYVNTYKQKEGQPDYVLHVLNDAPDAENEEGTPTKSATRRKAGPTPGWKPATKTAAKPARVVEEDDDPLV